MRRTKRAAHFCAAVALLALAVVPAYCQLPWPLAGKGLPPPGQVVVKTDIMIDSVESIDPNANVWNGYVWFHMQWKDDRAAAAIAQATSAWAANTAGSSFNNVTGCGMPCDYTGHPSAGCCDGVYMPFLEVPNIVGINQEAVYKWRLWLEPDPNNASRPLNIVHRTALVSATFRSPYDFRAWPFEHQHLLIELQAAPSQADRVSVVLESAMQLKDTPHTKGEIMPGWHTVKITKRTYDMSACYNATNMTSSVWNISDDGTQVAFKPLYPANWVQLSQVEPDDMQYTFMTENDCQQPLVMNSDTLEGLAGYAPQVVVVDIMIKRDLSFYVLAHVVPQILLAYLVFITYAMERSDLEARMGVVVTLVLAISALQFTWNFPAASYLNTVQQIMLMTYILYFVVAIESMIASHICRMHQRRRAHDKLVQITHNPTMPHGGAAGGGGNLGRPTLSNQPAPSSSLGTPQLQSGVTYMGQPYGGMTRGDAMAAAAAKAVAEVDAAKAAANPTATVAPGGKVIAVGLPPALGTTRDSAHSMRRPATATLAADARSPFDAANSSVGGPGHANSMTSGGSQLPLLQHGATFPSSSARFGSTTAATAARAGSASGSGSLVADADVALDVLPSPGDSTNISHRTGAGAQPARGGGGAGSANGSPASAWGGARTASKRHVAGATGAQLEEEASLLLQGPAPPLPASVAAGPVAEGSDAWGVVRSDQVVEMSAVAGRLSRAGPVAEARQAGEAEAAANSAAPMGVAAAGGKGVPLLNVPAALAQSGKAGRVPSKASAGLAVGQPSPTGMVGTPTAVEGGTRWSAFLGMHRRNVSVLGRNMSMRVSAAAAATRSLPSRLDKDEAFAQLFASRLDTIFCWTLLVCFSVVLAVLLWVNTQIGDHRLMLSSTSRPANM